jgi:succinyl-diaminopimelate desuccinylase
MDDIVALTRQLIQFRTTHDRPGEIQRCAEFIAAWLDSAGIAFTRLERAGVPSVLATPRPGEAPVLLMSHIDVVAAPESLFTPRIQNGRLYGRGSIDDKYAAALSLVLMRNWVQRRGNQADLPFGILITGDEEVGGRNGADYALGKVRGRFCIALDGGRCDEIVVQEKGLIRLRLVCRGRSAHGARPWLGDNAIDKLLRAYRRIGADFQQTAPDHWHRTVNFSQVQAGRSPNQVPDLAEGILDIRFTEVDDMDTLLAGWRRDTDAELEIVSRAPVFDAGPCPELDLLRRTVPEARLVREHGASDARFLAAHGWTGVVWGADGEMSQHGDNEHVVLESLDVLYRRLDRFLQGPGADPAS